MTYKVQFTCILKIFGGGQEPPLTPITATGGDDTVLYTDHDGGRGGDDTVL